jgi:hypothetical protein
MNRTNKERILEAEAALVFLNVGSEAAVAPTHLSDSEEVR